MDTVFFLIVFAFVAYGFFSGGKKKTRPLTRLQALAAKNKAASAKPKNPWNSQSAAADTEPEPDAQSAPPVKTITAKDALRLARLAKAGIECKQREKTAAHHNGGDLSDADRSKDVIDKNIHRRTDWGARAGPGVLSSRNLLILVAILFALMILSQLPSHLLR